MSATTRWPRASPSRTCKPRSFTAEELLATCRPHGVGRVNLIQMSYYRFDRLLTI
jgi:hypothetical protein